MLWPMISCGIYFYPRPPRGGRLSLKDGSVHTLFISIHALREEGDADDSDPVEQTEPFLSTPSARRATQSCHAQTGQTQDFYPRPPRGGRRATREQDTCTREISIHALREEGDFIVLFNLDFSGGISIHALREEGDAGRIMGKL